MKTLAFVLTTLVASSASAQTPTANCDGSRDLRFVNGKIVTMDKKNSTVAEVTIQNGVFTAVGRGGGRLSPCTKTIDLKGQHGRARPRRQPQPHPAARPAARHDTRLETAASIADVQATIKARAKSGSGRRVHHGDGRLELRAVRREADADARRARRGRRRSSRPPLSVVHGSGCGQHESAKRSSRGRNIAVSDTGAIAANAPSIAALNALRAIQTFDDQKRGTMDALAYSASVGVTTNVDMGAFLNPGLPDIQDSFTFDGAGDLQPVHDVRRDCGAPSRRQGSDARARPRLLPLDGHAAGHPDAEAAAAEQLQRASATTCCGCRASASSRRAGRSSATLAADQLRDGARSSSRSRAGRSSSTRSRRPKTN